MSEQMEWFKRFAAAYLRWANFNFDRIVRDAVNRQCKCPPCPENVYKLGTALSDRTR